MNRLRAVFHINEPQKWDVLIGNITNLLNDVGNIAVEVLVVTNGPAAVAYTDPETVERMRGLSDRGVGFIVCRNTLNYLCEGGVCISEENLPGFVQVVPAGVTELIRRQAEGYAYIKP